MICIKTKTIELFGGIGACTKALKNIGVDYELLDYVEIDKYAVQSFNAINSTNFKVQDICEWDKYFKDVDLLTHGSPCTDFSIAGKQEGGNEGSGTRSSLMWETVRIIEKIRPKYILWENVKNVLGKQHKHNFDNYLETLENLGYISFYKIINLKDYLPHNRERIFCISILKSLNVDNFVFNKYNFKIKGLGDILESFVDEKYYVPIEKNNSIKEILKNKSSKIIDMCQSKREGKPREYDYFPTLNARDYKEPRLVNLGDRIRKATPLEYWRAQGFSDEDFMSAKKSGLSDTQLYKQAGNSIGVPILEDIFKSIFMIKSK